MSATDNKNLSDEDDDYFENGPEQDNFAMELRNNAMKFPRMTSLVISENQMERDIISGYEYRITDNLSSNEAIDVKYLKLSSNINESDSLSFTDLLTDLGMDSNWENDLLYNMHLPMCPDIQAPPLIRDPPANFKEGTYYTRYKTGTVLSGPYVTLPNSKMICAHGKFVGFTNSDTEDVRFGNEIGTYYEMEYEMGVLRRFDFYGANESDTLEPIYNKSEGFVFTAYFDRYGYLTEIHRGDLINNDVDISMTIDRETGVITSLEAIPGEENRIKEWLSYSIKNNRILSPISDLTLNQISRYCFFGPQIGLIEDERISYFYDGNEVTEEIFYQLINNDVLTFKKDQIDTKKEIDKYISIPGIQDIIIRYARVTPKWLDVLTKARNNLHSRSTTITNINTKINKIIYGL